MKQPSRKENGRQNAGAGSRRGRRILPHRRRVSRIAAKKYAGKSAPKAAEPCPSAKKDGAGRKKKETKKS